MKTRLVCLPIMRWDSFNPKNGHSLASWKRRRVRCKWILLISNELFNASENVVQEVFSTLSLVCCLYSLLYIESHPFLVSGTRSNFTLHHGSDCLSRLSAAVGPTTSRCLERSNCGWLCFQIPPTCVLSIVSSSSSFPFDNNQNFCSLTAQDDRGLLMAQLIC